MKRIIIADNQPLTALAVESLSRDIINQGIGAGLDASNVKIEYASNRMELAMLLRDDTCSTAIILDYTMFDFPNTESLVIMSEANKNTSWLLLSDELTADFLRYVLRGRKTFYCGIL